MAQQYPYPPRAYSPPRSTPSPHPGAYMPPNKRQRLSPNPQSPYNSPSITNGSLPNQVFSSPHFGAQPNGYQARPYGDSAQGAPPVQYQPPQLPPSAGAMGPPSRPIDKPTDVNDLSDVLAGSGVDLKEEEAALFNRFNTPNTQQNGTSFTSDPATSFGSNGPNGQQASSFNPYNQLNTLSANIPGGKVSFYGAGTLNQSAIPVKTAEERYEDEKKRAIRRKLERRQYQLNDPFLQGAVVNARLAKHSQTEQISFPREGLLTSNGQKDPISLYLVGPDNNEVLTTVRGEDLLYLNSPLVDILSLISLATQERLRGVVEDAGELAKGRRVGSHGAVPPDLVDLAVGGGTFDTAFLPTPGNSAVSPMTNPLKRPYSEVNKLPTPVSAGPVAPNIPFPSQTIPALQKTATGDRSAEDERASKRAKRAANLLSAEVSRAGSVSGGTPGPGTPGMIGERAPEVEVKKGNKKDQKKQADAKATEAQQHAATNQTMNMQLGFGKKKPSWMTSTRDTSASNFPVPSRMNTSFSTNKATNGLGANGLGGLPKRQFGDFREDKETGAGIQMRDMALVLDPEWKEKKALAKAFTKLNQKK
ncbi:hypothetical protein MMC30_004314 [Trapelia coarctata]|nr:hypothetical protein [Trapelia coarctata]